MYLDDETNSVPSANRAYMLRRLSGSVAVEEDMVDQADCHKLARNPAPRAGRLLGS